MGRIIIFFVVLSLLFMTSCSLSPFTQNGLNEPKQSRVSLKAMVPKDFIPRNLQVVSVGDSLTEGVGDSTNRGGYIPYLEQLLEGEKGIQEARFTNFGVKGNRTTQMLERIKSSEIQSSLKTADVVIITIGGNDVMKVVRENLTHLHLDDFKPEMENYRKSLNEVINTIRAENPNCKIVLVGLYNPFFQWFADLKEMNQIINDWNLSSKSILSLYEDTYFIEISDLFINSQENLLYTDYFHPNDRGYELIAERVFGVLEANKF